MQGAPPQAQTPEALFQQAVRTHQAGDKSAAAAAYRQVLDLDPTYLGAYLNLGTALRQLGRRDEALDLFAEALLAHPNSADLHYNRGRALLELRRNQDALKDFDRAAELAPDRAVFHVGRASILAALGQDEAALAAFDRAVELEPANAGIHVDRATAALRCNRNEEALKSLDSALAAQPDSAPLLRNKGVALRRLNRRDEALAVLQAAARLDPPRSDVFNALGNVQRDLRRFEDALVSYDRALALAPQHADNHNSRGSVLVDLGRYDEALAAHDQAVAIAPNLPNSHGGRGTALTALGRYEDALESFDRALALQPASALFLHNRAVLLRRLGRPAEAVENYDQALAISPGYDEARWHRSLCNLTLARFEQGWLDYEYRWRNPQFIKDCSSTVTSEMRERLNPQLTAQDLAGRDVLVVGEQGVGDQIMFASMLPDLEAAGARINLYCELRLGRIFSTSFPNVRLLQRQEALERLPTFDHVVTMGSLGRLYRNSVEAFPGQGYLTIEPEAKARWAERLGPAMGRKRIGVSWRGGLVTTGVNERSIPLEQLRPILTLPGCEFVSLQYGQPEAEVAEVNATLESPIRVFPKAEIDEFQDLAGLVQNLDLIISVQTSLVHLSGALDVPALVMVPFVPEWRYTAALPRMPWYGSVTLHRQGADKNWSPVIQRVAEAAIQRLGLEAGA